MEALVKASDACLYEYEAVKSCIPRGTEYMGPARETHFVCASHNHCVCDENHPRRYCGEMRIKTRLTDAISPFPIPCSEAMKTVCSNFLQAIFGGA
jgi:hypothetical protein